MQKQALQRVASWLLVACFLLPHRRVAGRFFEITTEITFDDWGSWFLSDKENLLSSTKPPRTLSAKAETRRCVVGADTWMMEGRTGDDQNTLWFTGTNVIRYTLNTNDTVGWQNSFEVPKRSTRINPSLDGNPESTGAISFIDLPGKVCWLAFCSGPCFRQKNHKIFPPHPDWIESSVSNGIWNEQANVFPDRLGLPQSIDLISTNNQLFFQYQVHQTTNLFGWSFPLEFYGVQYYLRGPVTLSFKGRVTSIHETSEPKIPAEVFSAKREAR